MVLSGSVAVVTTPAMLATMRFQYRKRIAGARPHGRAARVHQIPDVTREFLLSALQFPEEAAPTSSA